MRLFGFCLMQNMFSIKIPVSFPTTSRWPFLSHPMVLFLLLHDCSLSCLITFFFPVITVLSLISITFPLPSWFLPHDSFFFHDSLSCLMTSLLPWLSLFMTFLFLSLDDSSVSLLMTSLSHLMNQPSRLITPPFLASWRVPSWPHDTSHPRFMCSPCALWLLLLSDIWLSLMTPLSRFIHPSIPSNVL